MLTRPVSSQLRSRTRALGAATASTLAVQQQETPIKKVSLIPQITLSSFSRMLTLESSQPIYSQPAPPVTLVETHTALESHVGDARRAVVGAAQGTKETVQGHVERWIGVERAVEREYGVLYSFRLRQVWRQCVRLEQRACTLSALHTRSLVPKGFVAASTMHSASHSLARRPFVVCQICVGLWQ